MSALARLIVIILAIPIVLFIIAVIVVAHM